MVLRQRHKATVRQQAPFLMCVGVILVVGAGLRLWRLEDFPPGIHVDEAGIGYNAFSIAMTGRDERGEWLPLYCRAWGAGHEYAKYPVFTYSAVAAIRLLGPSIGVLRGVSVFYGLLGIALTAFVGRQSFGKTVGLLAALLLAVQPMHQSHSRSGVELITFPCFLAAGALFMLSALRRRRHWPAAALCFALTFYCYGVAKAFVPMLVVGFLILNWRLVRPHWRWLALGGVVALVALVPDILFTLSGGGAEHFRLISVFGERGASQGRAILSRLSWLPGIGALAGNDFFASLATAVASYLRLLSPVFLCINGGDTVKCGVTKMGLLHIFEVPTLIIGVAMLIRDRRRPPCKLFLLWFLLYPLADSLTFPPSIARMSSSLPALSIVSALGLKRVFDACSRVGAPSRRTGVLLTLALSVLMAREVYSYYRVYFGDHFTSVFFQWHQHDLDALEFARQHEADYDQIVFVDYYDYYSYVVLLFALEADPHEWQTGRTAGRYAILHCDEGRKTMPLRGRVMTIAYPNHVKQGRHLCYIMDPTGTVKMLEARDIVGEERLELGALESR